MSPTPAKTNRPDPSVPKAQAAAHYATVSEQIDEQALG